MYTQFKKKMYFINIFKKRYLKSYKFEFSDNTIEMLDKHLTSRLPYSSAWWGRRKTQ